MKIMISKILQKIERSHNQHKNNTLKIFPIKIEFKIKITKIINSINLHKFLEMMMIEYNNF